MSSPNPLIAPTTGAVTIQLQAQEADQVIIYATGTWGALENATVNVPTSTASTTAYIDPAIGAPIVGNSPPCVLLEGGFLYTIIKPGTAAAAGLDYQFKPRAGM